MNKWGQIHQDNGPFVSSRYWSDSDRLETEVHYHHREKSDVMMAVCSSWYGGDMMEFGSGDLNTFRDFLTAYNICGMTRAYSDVKFYAFDVFGKLEEDVGDLKAYFNPYTRRGDTLLWHQNLLNEHGLYVDKCQLVQGLFSNTLTPEFKEKWCNDKSVIEDHSQTALHLPLEFRNSAKRQIGFASIDCNIPSSYKTVFEFIFDMLAPNSYVYLDEGLQSPEVMCMWQHFVTLLQVKRRMYAQYIRNAGGFGSLWRLYPTSHQPLSIEP